MRGKVIVYVGVAVMCMCVGCKSSRVAEAEAVRDTIVRFHSDTVVRDRIVVEWRERERRDSVIIREDSAGRVIYKEIWRDRYVDRYKVDSSRVYKARADSAVRARAEKREVVKEKKRNCHGWTIAGILICVGGIVGLGYVIKLSA